MAAVTDSESSYPHTCSVPHPSASSYSRMFLSPGQTLPVTPAVSPLSPLHYENVLGSPIPVSLMPSPSQVLDKVGPTSPQHQLTVALQQSVRPEPSYSHPALISAQSPNPLHAHTVSAQNTHPATNGSTQTLIKVTMEAAAECRCLAKGCKDNSCLICCSFIYIAAKLLFVFELRISIHKYLWDN